MKKTMLVLFSMVLFGGCIFSDTPVERKVVMVIPGDPVWLVNDVEDVPVLVRDAKGKFVYGKATLRAGCVVWYDNKWNDKTINAEDKEK